MFSCDYDKNDPDRPVDWRWNRAACLLHENEPINGRSGDSWVRRAIDYQLARRACRSEQELEHRNGQYPSFAAAFTIWSNPRSLRKATLEAAILARESDTTVGQRLGLSAQTVEVYEALFFNVREKLPFNCYIMGRAIGTKVYTGLSGGDFDLILKMIAYQCGPGMIDLVLSLYSAAPREQAEYEASQSSAERTSDNILTKILILSMLNHGSIEALGILLSVLATERKWKSGEISTEAFDEVLDGFLADFNQAIAANPEPIPGLCLPDRQEVQGAGSGRRRQSVARPGRRRAHAKVRA